MIKRANAEDTEILAALAIQMWTGHNLENLAEEFRKLVMNDEAVRRIKEYEGLKRIIVCTNSNLAAPKNYESVGFQLYDRKPNESESAFTGDYLYYEIVI